MKPTSSNFLYLISIAVLERCSFYGVRGVLILYLTKAFMQSPAEAFEITGLMFALSMFIALLIGALNDRLQHLGQMIVAGLFCTLSGTVLLMITRPESLLLAIALISLGSAAIKATLPTLLANVQGKSRSELYTYLYVANNVGALLGTGLCGIIGEVFGWNWGFALSGVMLFIGAILILRIESNRVDHFFRNLWKILTLLVPLLALVWILLVYREFAIGVILLSFVIALSVGARIQAKNKAWKDFGYLLLLLGLLLLFTIVYEQGGLSLVLFTDKLVDRSLSPGLSQLFGISQIPVTLFSNVDATANIIIGLLLASFYKWRNAPEKRSTYLSKFILGFGFALLNFVILTRMLQGDSLVPAGLVVLYYVLFVCGEQLAYPVVMTASIALSPEKHRSFFLSLVMTASAVGIILAAEVSTWMYPAPGTPITASLLLYQGHAQHAAYIISGIIVFLLVGRFIALRTSSSSEGF